MSENNNHLLLFSLHSELFGISVENVVRVVNLEKVIKIPKAPTYVVGAINLEGNVIPLVDLANKIELGKTTVSEELKVIILEVIVGEDKMEVGVLINEVLDVVQVDSSAIKPPPLDNMGFDHNALEGMYKTEEEFYMVISAGKIFESELASIAQ